jgi:hypothetical protein
MYANGKIYRIVGNVENSKCYIGSTVRALSNRMAGHRGAHKRFQNGLGTKLMSFDLFDEYGVENCRIVLIENFPCNSKEELLKRERYWIENIVCVNKYIPTRTIEEWNEENKDYQNQYRETHKEKINKRNKEYRETNIDKIRLYRNQKFECECGGSYLNSNKARHEMTQKHMQFIVLEG